MNRTAFSGEVDFFCNSVNQCRSSTFPSGMKIDVNNCSYAGLPVPQPTLVRVSIAFNSSRSLIDDRALARPSALAP